VYTIRLRSAEVRILTSSALVIIVHENATIRFLKLYFLKRMPSDDLFSLCIVTVWAL
jgi:hypothetical protein